MLRQRLVKGEYGGHARNQPRTANRRLWVDDLMSDYGKIMRWKKQ